MNPRRHICGALAATCLLAGCSTVPGTDRERLNLVSSGQMQQLGAEGFRSILDNKTVVEQGPDADRVRVIADRVVRSAKAMYPTEDLPDTWEVVLVEDDTPNAFALPGGRIGVHTGMLDVADSDDGLAVVLGHEVGHVLAEHAAERMSQSMLVAGGLALGGAALSDQHERTRAIGRGAMGIGATIGVSLPYSRLHEAEADELGLMITAHAGYDPRAALPLWRRMAKSGDRTVEFLSTHPAPMTRVESLRQLMPSAMRMYRAATR